MTLHLENSKTLVLNAPNNTAENKYINSINYNGKVYNYNWLDHAEMLKGGTINFDMTAQPNKQRGTAPSSFPYSLSNEK